MTTTKFLESINYAFREVEGKQFKNGKELQEHLSQEDEFQFSRFITFAVACELSRKRGYGCVSFWSQGSHHDMDYRHFLQSTGVFYRYFAGEDLSSIDSFLPLKRRGQKLEEEMFHVTGGVNTQKGLLFLLMFVANLYQRKIPLCRYQGEIRRICQEIRPPENTTGSRIRKKYPVRSIVEEAKEGFASLFTRYLPEFQKNHSLDDLTITIFQHTDDTTTIHRSGMAKYRQYQALDLSTEKNRQLLHETLLQDGSTTGGVADLLSITLLLYLLNCKEKGDFSSLSKIRRSSGTDDF